MTTVLAHGCFDLLHLGHIKHLQEARKLGDRLVVSITDDKFVSKGIGRPHFTAQQRADALKALACVDDVIISEEPGAINIIRTIKPAVYVKGIDYKGANGSDILTKEEHEAVAAVGARIHITTSEKFSSSRIINTERFSPEVVQYLEKAKVSGFKPQIMAAFERADQLKISFIGEIIVDEYRYVQGLGRASKELMLATVEVGSEIFEGGSIAASKHAEWPKVEWMSPPVNIKKTRYVDKDFNRKLFDVYSAQRVQLSDVSRKQLRKHLADIVKDCDVIVAMDFGHGLIEKEEREILRDAAFLAVNAQSNAGNYGYNLITKYDTAEFICIDDPEARLAVGMQNNEIEFVVKELEKRIACDRFLITHGKFGSAYYDHPQFGIAPAFVSGGIDTMGAGDAVMAVTAPLLAVCLPIEMAAFVGNIAGAIKTSIIGHRRHVGRQEIIQTVEALLA